MQCAFGGIVDFKRSTLLSTGSDTFEYFLSHSCYQNKRTGAIKGWTDLGQWFPLWITSQILQPEQPQAFPAQIVSIFYTQARGGLPAQGTGHIWLPLLWYRLRWPVLPEESRIHGKPCWMEGWFCRLCPGSVGWGTCMHSPSSEAPFQSPAETQNGREKTLAFCECPIMQTPPSETRLEIAPSSHLNKNAEIRDTPGQYNLL